MFRLKTTTKTERGLRLQPQNTLVRDSSYPGKPFPWSLEGIPEKVGAKKDSLTSDSSRPEKNPMEDRGQERLFVLLVTLCGYLILSREKAQNAQKMNWVAGRSLHEVLVAFSFVRMALALRAPLRRELQV